MTNDTVYTVGHSTRSMESFTELLERFGIGLLVDVRSMPGSDHNPQFNKEAFSDSLEQAGIDYLHMERLGGYRNAELQDSANEGWENESFQ